MNREIEVQELLSAIRRQGSSDAGAPGAPYPAERVLKSIYARKPLSDDIERFRKAYRKSPAKGDVALEIIHCWALLGLRITGQDMTQTCFLPMEGVVNLKELRQFLDGEDFQAPAILFDEGGTAIYWVKGEREIAERLAEISGQLDDLDIAEREAEQLPSTLERLQGVAFVEHRRSELMGEFQTLNQRFHAMQANLTKRQRQARAIGVVIEDLGFSPLAIPVGGKARIRSECLKQPQLFTESTFKSAWNSGSKAGLWSVERKDRFQAK